MKSLEEMEFFMDHIERILGDCHATLILSQIRSHHQGARNLFPSGYQAVFADCG
jgi:hypothetical protein